jgi:predicted nucleic-acid-binding protein
VTGLDTNVLVRYLTEDEPAQARKAAAWIQTVVSRKERCYISAIVLCELAWVLRGAYEVSKNDLLLTLDRLLATTQFVIGDKDVVRAGLEAYRSGRADFADYVIGAVHGEAGCTTTVTFDRRLRDSALFQML